MISNSFKNFNVRKLILMLVDIFIIEVSALISNYILLFDKSISILAMTISLIETPIMCFLSLYFMGAYKILWRYCNCKDYFRCAIGMVIGVLFSAILLFVCNIYIDFYYVGIHMLTSIVGIILFRVLFKNTFLELVNLGKKSVDTRKRTMIIGGGLACKLILKELESNYVDNPSSKYNPICIIDDNDDLVGKQIGDVPIVGTTKDIMKMTQQNDIDLILFAIPSCDVDRKKEILNLCSLTKLPIKVIPYLGNMIFDEKHPNIINQFHDIKIEDLLGREPIKFNKDEIQTFINNKICMITGGGGSIGSELTRQIAKYNPKQIIIVDNYENNAYDIQQELIMKYGKSLNLVTLIASVQDYNRMNSIFKKYQPDVVFHAAAHKHVPLMENSPMEAIKNNVVGTFNMATLSDFYKVKKFVMISTDKAVNPTNVMGASKRCCEMVIQYISKQKGTQTEFVTTRFGNVLGSNGSVIPLFKRQIEAGRSVTVTHPDIIRYFMTIPEAVSLVLEAGSMAKGGEIFVMDMGEPVKILTLAENLIRMYGKIPYDEIAIEFTGLRPGEKLFEELLMNEEGLQKTENNKIFIGNQIDINNEEFLSKLIQLKNCAYSNNEDGVINALHEIVPTYINPEQANKTVLAC